jgi:hypothetical protein
VGQFNSADAFLELNLGEIGVKGIVFKIKNFHDLPFNETELAAPG